MAKTNFRGYLKADLVPLKKYFYVLRPLLAVRWLERYGTAVPIQFYRLLHLIQDYPDLVADIKSLLERKRQVPELGLEPPVPSIHSFVEHELDRLEALIPPVRARATYCASSTKSSMQCSVKPRPIVAKKGDRPWMIDKRRDHNG